MRKLRMIGALAVAAVAAAGCEDITNPIQEMGEFAPPWVLFSAATGTAPHGAYVPVILRAQGRPEMDVEIDFTLGGTAVFGQDYIVVTDTVSGTPRGGITASGGTITIPYDPATASPDDTLWVYVPTTAVPGRTIIATITGARGSAGPVTVGHRGNFTTHTRTIVRAPATIPTGTYRGQQTGGATGDAETVITRNPITVDGTQYQYRMSDYANMLHGVPVGWAFNVYVDGSMDFAPRSHTHNVTGPPVLTGTYNIAANSMSVHVQYSPTFAWGLELTHVGS
jgi:hypothetical protein